MFKFTQRIAQTADCFAAHWSGCDAPLHKSFMRTRNRFVVIVVRSGTDAGKPPPVDRRNFLNCNATAAPFAIEHAGVVVGETKFFERCFHKRSPAVMLSGAKNIRSFHS